MKSIFKHLWTFSERSMIQTVIVNTSSAFKQKNSKHSFLLHRLILNNLNTKQPPLSVKTIKKGGFKC